MKFDNLANSILEQIKPTGIEEHSVRLVTDEGGDETAEVMVHTNVDDDIILRAYAYADEAGKFPKDAILGKTKNPLFVEVAIWYVNDQIEWVRDQISDKRAENVPFKVTYY
jgi:hypothetical protein